MIDIENERTQLRSRMVGGLRAEHAGEGMELVGWVHRLRNLGGIGQKVIQNMIQIVNCCYLGGLDQ